MYRRDNITRAQVNKKSIKISLKQYLSKPSAKFCARWTAPWALNAMRKLNDIQLSRRELESIIGAIKSRSRCRLLVFGLGNDSLFWSSISPGGKTVFLEDNEYWFDKILRQHQNLNAFLVNYNSKRTQWEEFLHSPELLDMELPDDVLKNTWDVILVDAPAGYDDSSPGRMKSIYLASRLSCGGGDVFVDDCDREIEDIYSTHYLKDKNLVRKIGKLKHYNLQILDSKLAIVT